MKMRRRPVRTTTDEGWSTWSLPGVTEDWNFLPATDEDGRTRWNVYPLLGAPNADFDWDRLGIDESAQDPVDVLTTEPLTFASLSSSGGTVISEVMPSAEKAPATAGSAPS